MSLLRSIAGGFRSLFRKEQVNEELDEELNGFLEMAAEEKMKQGLRHKDALRAVRLERGSLEVSFDPKCGGSGFHLYRSSEIEGQHRPFLDHLSNTSCSSDSPTDDGIRHRSRLSARNEHSAFARSLFYGRRYYRVAMRRCDRQRFREQLFSRTRSAGPDHNFWLGSPVGPLSHRRRSRPCAASGPGNESSYAQAQAYYPLYQIPDQWVTGSEGFPTTTIIVRTPLPAAAVIPAIKNVLYGMGKDQPIYNVESMQEIASESMSAQHFPMILLGAFAALALLLASSEFTA